MEDTQEFNRRYTLDNLIEEVASIIHYRSALTKLSYFLGLHPHVNIRREVVTFKDHSFRSLKIAFASDFHAGLTTDWRVIEDACEVIKREAPDILLLGGDFVSHKAAYIDPLAEHLKSISAPLGKYAVLGNHDYWAGAYSVVKKLEQSAVYMVTNQSVRLLEGLHLCGIDDASEGTPDACRAFKETTGIKILLTHSPEALRFLDKRSFQLGFCGHTHGGQIALPGGVPLWVPPGDLCRKYAHGKFTITQSNGEEGTLLVSRGVGCSTLALRLFSPPDLIFVELRGVAAE